MTSQMTAPIFSNPAYTTNGTTSSTGSTGSSSNGSQSSSASGALGESDFLTLLIAQMKNQDPLNPQDDSSFVAELATFSSVQQQTQMNQTIQQSTAASLIGESVKSSGGVNGVVANAGVNSNGVYVTINTTVTDKSGKTTTVPQQVPYSSITEIDGFSSSNASDTGSQSVSSNSGAAGSGTGTGTNG